MAHSRLRRRSTAADAFNVTVKTQPSAQTCAVTGGTGTMGSGDASDVVVNCSSDRFAVGGSVSGLAGGNVVFQNKGGDDITVSANGSFAFPTLAASGDAYAVTVKMQPSSPAQTCSVASGSGVVSTSAVSSVRVVCSTNAYKVGGTVSGLVGTGLVLQNNAGDNLALNADGSFAFAAKVASGAAYAVTVLTQPAGPAQTCTVTKASGTIAGADVSNVAVDCTSNTYAVGGTVVGLVGMGLVLQNNAGDDLVVAQNGTFAFASKVASGVGYAVSIKTQPAGPSQTCAVSGGSGTVGTGNVTSVTVNCNANSFTVGGSVSGLAGTLVIENNASDALTLSQNGSFAFATPIASGGSYAVTVKTQPGAPSQTCTIANASGTMGSSNVSSLAITCTTRTMTVGGTVSGLVGNGLVLRNGVDSLAIAADGAFAFATKVPSGGTYDVTVSTQPADPSQTCAITNAAGAVTNSDMKRICGLHDEYLSRWRKRYGACRRGPRAFGQRGRHRHDYAERHVQLSDADREQRCLQRGGGDKSDFAVAKLYCLQCRRCGDQRRRHEHQRLVHDEYVHGWRHGERARRGR